MLDQRYLTLEKFVFPHTRLTKSRNVLGTNRFRIINIHGNDVPDFVVRRKYGERRYSGRKVDARYVTTFDLIQVQGDRAFCVRGDKLFRECL